MSSDEPCPSCNIFVGVTFKEEVRPFKYRSGDEQIELTAKVVVGHCETCTFEWTDVRAELSQTDAVCKFLQFENKILKAEIVELKKRDNLVKDKLNEFYHSLTQ